MILEGVITTTNDDGTVNIAPMGPAVDPGMQRLLLRPFQSSTTYGNLTRTETGVFHVIDDVDFLARAVIGELDPLPPIAPCQSTGGHILTEACRWYAFRIVSTEVECERAEMDAVVVASARLRDFFGFNRAKHAVIEAAILATRIGIISPEQIRAEFSRLAPLVEKTGGDQEHRAFARLEKFVRDKLI